MERPCEGKHGSGSPFTGIHHLALVTGDMDATVRFWRDLLGLRLVVGLGAPGYRQYFFEISERDFLAFFEWPGVEPMEPKDHGAPVRGKLGFDHVSLGVATSDVLWELKDRLSAAGFWVSEVIDHGFMHSIYSFDPNEIPIELSWTPPEPDVRCRPRLIDREPSGVAREGPEPQAGRWPAVTAPTPFEERRTYPGPGSELIERQRG